MGKAGAARCQHESHAAIVIVSVGFGDCEMSGEGAANSLQARCITYFGRKSVKLSDSCYSWSQATSVAISTSVRPAPLKEHNFRPTDVPQMKNGISMPAESMNAGGWPIPISEWCQSLSRDAAALRKKDIALEGHNAYYSVADIESKMDKQLSVNVMWHNGIGSPFLESGCWISLSATRFASAPKGTESDSTGRLAQAAIFDTLEAVPLIPCIFSALYNGP